MNTTLIIIGSIAIVYLLVITIVNACEIHFLKEELTNMKKEIKKLNDNDSKLFGMYNNLKTRQLKNK